MKRVYAGNNRAHMTDFEGIPRVLCIAQEAGVSKSSLHHIVKKELHLYLYKIQMLQILTPFSKQRRLAFVENFCVYLADHLSALPH